MTARQQFYSAATRSHGVQRLVGLLERRRRAEILQHRAGRGGVQPHAVVLPDRKPDAQDVAIAARLLAAYRAAVAHGHGGHEYGAEDLWTAIQRRKRAFASVLEHGSAAQLAGILCNVARHPASQGILQGRDEYERITHDASYRAFLARTTQDTLVSLAEALGAVAVENPAQGTFGINVRGDPGALVAAMEQRLDIDLAPPEVDGALLKLHTPRGLFGERDLNAIFTAHLLTRVLRGAAQPRICEIGSGSGRAAYWAHRLGLRALTLVDLPDVNVVQGYYLLKGLAQGEVTLYGEDETAGSDGVTILPAGALPTAGDRRFDLVLNQDSFPEMASVRVREYLAWIRRSAQRLLSINHESKPRYGRGLVHSSVPEEIASVGGFALEDRFPYWLRRGYVYELYRVVT